MSIKESMAYKKNRIKKTIMGCETREQLNAAIKYCERFAAGNMVLEVCMLACCLKKESCLCRADK